ncbi:MAG: hypothetical protein A2666_03055 [Parcubacteria group bacterium RIFCSPHIGHO2_01_FULL_47_10b]|nr:MAG: hypothetical protein A2666_03055 [Parcubacteria group bacterium RIFCSPHIGHO2_01_FULL_47_10b]
MDAAVAILLVTPNGIPLVRDPKKPAPLYWKLPGGRSENKETPGKAAIRELKEEVGVALDEKDLEALYTEERDTHTFFLFQAAVNSSRDIRKHGNEGEEVRLFLPEDLKKLPDFFPSHREILTEIKYF